MAYSLSKTIDIPEIPAVYKITNTVNGKFYIGSTINLRKRMMNHANINQAKGATINKAIRKYGIYSFLVDVLFEGNRDYSREYLFEKEQNFIDTIDDWSCCYNSHKIVRLVDYNQNPTMVIVSQYSSIDKSFIRSYSSIAHAARMSGCYESCIWQCVNGASKTSGGFIWLKDEPPHDLSDYTLNEWEIPVSQYTKSAEFVSDYQTIRQAACAVSSEGMESKISEVLAGRRKSACGFLWTRFGDEAPTPYRRSSPKRKDVYLLSENGEHIEMQFQSSRHAAEWFIEHGGWEFKSPPTIDSVSSIIRRTARGERPNAYGRLWTH